MIWASPPLPAAPIDFSRIMPVSDIGRRVGHTLYRMVRALLAPAWLMGEAIKAGTGEDRGWADMLAGYELEAIPPQVSIAIAISMASVASRVSIS